MSDKPTKTDSLYAIVVYLSTIPFAWIGVFTQQYYAFGIPLIIMGLIILRRERAVLVRIDKDIVCTGKQAIRLGKLFIYAGILIGIIIHLLTL